MPNVTKAKFCRDAYLRNDTSPETLDKIKSLLDDTEVMPCCVYQLLIEQKVIEKNTCLKHNAFFCQVKYDTIKTKRELLVTVLFSKL